MEDSFESRLNGEFKPIENKAKGGKGWMVTSIILMVLLVGAGVFAGIMTVSNNTNGDKALKYEAQASEKETKIAELETTITNKEAEIATLKNASVTPGTSTTPAPTTTAKKYSDFKLDIAGLMKLINKDNAEYGKVTTKSLDLVKVEFTSDDKYLIVATNIFEGVSGYAGVYYKEVGADTSWKVLHEGHQFPCENATAEAKKFMEAYKSFDDGLNSKWVQCAE